MRRFRTELSPDETSENLLLKSRVTIAVGLTALVGLGALASNSESIKDTVKSYVYTQEQRPCDDGSFEGEFVRPGWMICTERAEG